MPVDVDRIIALDREALANARERDEITRQERLENRDAATKTSQRLKVLQSRNNEIKKELERLLLTVPNLPHESVPVGEDRTHDVVRSTSGEIEKPYFDVKPHWEIGTELGLLDFENARKVSGRGFVLYRGACAILARGLIELAIDVHRKQGYEEIAVPSVVNKEALVASGRSPAAETSAYRLGTDDLFLNPEAGVYAVNLHRKSSIAPERLPIRYAAYGPCFRREVGGYGARTKGLLGVHQFDTVELVALANPEASYEELETVAGDSCAVLEALALPFRVVERCTGVLGFAAAKCYDIETYAPGAGRWLKVSSCSNFEAYQARRAGIKIKEGAGKKRRFVHTISGSGLAVARVVAALLEVHQTPTGRVKIPASLRAHMQGREYLG